MKKRTDYILFPPGYNLPIAHLGTMKQVKRFLRKNPNQWIYVNKWITTKSHRSSILSYAQYLKYLTGHYKHV